MFQIPKTHPTVHTYIFKMYFQEGAQLNTQSTHVLYTGVKTSVLIWIKICSHRPCDCHPDCLKMGVWDSSFLLKPSEIEVLCSQLNIWKIMLSETIPARLDFVFLHYLSASTSGVAGRILWLTASGLRNVFSPQSPRYFTKTLQKPFIRLSSEMFSKIHSEPPSSPGCTVAPDSPQQSSC